jgi:two-component system, chemotaxis family, chemotaxis protein CheY
MGVYGMAKRVLVVDDAMIMRMRIKEIAREAGWEIAGEAVDGADAIAKYRELRPDMMTMDIVMPQMDGVTALKAIREEDANARVVMVSAVDQKLKLTECIRLGAIDFVVKPFNRENLKSLFEKMARDENP